MLNILVYKIFRRQDVNNQNTSSKWKTSTVLGSYRRFRRTCLTILDNTCLGLESISKSHEKKLFKIVMKWFNFFESLTMNNWTNARYS